MWHQQHGTDTVRERRAFMVRSQRISIGILAALAFALGAGGGIARSLKNSFVEGHPLRSVVQVVPSLVITGAALFFLTLLYLRQQAKDSKQSQQRLNEETKKLNTAISHMAQGLLMFDASHRLVLSNNRYLDLHGLAPEIVKPGISLRDLLIHREKADSFSGDIAEYCDKLTLSLREGRVFTVLGGAGDGRLVRIVNTPLEGGGWVSTHEDITENQRLIDALKEAEAIARRKGAQLDAALNHIVQGLCMFDHEGRMVLFNRRYC